MLTKLSIKNFQAHEQLEVSFDPHVTTVVGPSDVGKSAVIRALLWLATNKPAGTDFIREGTKAADVTLETGGKTIHRHRSASVNTYEVDWQELKAFGSDVPPEVLKALNIGPINFQGQHDSPFWFGETAGEVSRQLNQIVDLGIIDSTLANLDSLLREARERVRVGVDRLAEAKARRTSLKSAREMNSQLTALEGLSKTQECLATNTARMGSLVEGLREGHDKASQASCAKEAASAVCRRGELWQTPMERAGLLRGMLRKAEGLSEVVARPVPDVAPLLGLLVVLQSKQRRVEAVKGLLFRGRGLEETLSRPVPDVSPLEALRRKVDEIRGRRETLEELTTAAQSDETALRRGQELATKAKDNFEALMGEVCPLCGKKQ